MRLISAGAAIFAFLVGAKYVREDGVTTTIQAEDVEGLSAGGAPTDASPGAILVEWQLETGTSPTQNVLAGSFYRLGSF